MLNQTCVSFKNKDTWNYNNSPFGVIIYIIYLFEFLATESRDFRKFSINPWNAVIWNWMSFSVNFAKV